jgi:hypothetical protein
MTNSSDRNNERQELYKKLALLNNEVEQVKKRLNAIGWEEHNERVKEQELIELSRLAGLTKVTIKLINFKVMEYTVSTIGELVDLLQMKGEGMQYYFFKGKQLNWRTALIEQGVQNGDEIYWSCFSCCIGSDHDQQVEKLRQRSIPPKAGELV